jgi:hypothetical protein
LSSLEQEEVDFPGEVLSLIEEKGFVRFDKAKLEECLTVRKEVVLASTGDTEVG